MAKVDCSGILVEEPSGTLAGGTGMYVDIRDNLEAFWTEYSGSGPFGVWMLTARPLKQGMMPLIASKLFDIFENRRLLDLNFDRLGVNLVWLRLLRPTPCLPSWLYSDLCRVRGAKICPSIYSPSVG